MKTLLRRFTHDDQGQDLIEYGLLIGIISAGAILAITELGPKVTNYFSTLNSTLPPG